MRHSRSYLQRQEDIMRILELCSNPDHPCRAYEMAEELKISPAMTGKYIHALLEEKKIFCINPHQSYNHTYTTIKSLAEPSKPYSTMKSKVKDLLDGYRRDGDDSYRCTHDLMLLCGYDPKKVKTYNLTQVLKELERYGEVEGYCKRKRGERYWRAKL